MVTQWFAPDPSSKDADDKVPSGAKRHGKPEQLYMTGFSLFYFIFLAVATLSHV